MTFRGVAWSSGFAPTVLKGLMLDCGLTQEALRARVEKLLGCPVSRPTINLAVNRGYAPPTMARFRAMVAQAVSELVPSGHWLAAHGLTLEDLWKPLGEPHKNEMPAGHGRRTSVGRAAGPALTPGDPLTLTPSKEVEMLRQETLRHFRLFRTPFPLNGGVEKASDIYRSEDHRYLEAAMLEAALHGGCLAVVAQVGGGKSVMRKSVCEQLRQENIKVIFPQIIDKSRITAASLCDAIILDISDQTPRSKNEQKARQVKALLAERSREGTRCCLILEEAHRLTVPAFKMVKQLYELEDGFKKLLSVILIGQTELGEMLDETRHPEMREVIRRTQIARIDGLGANLSAYLDHKFNQVRASLDAVFDAEAVASLGKRLTGHDERGKPFSTAYPLSVNNYVCRAMNLAYEMGEARVTADVVEAL